MANVYGATRPKVFALFLSAVFLLVGFATTAGAQQYPPPTPTKNPDKPKNDKCAVTYAQNRRGEYRKESDFVRGERIFVGGKKNCTKKNARVEIWIDHRDQRSHEREMVRIGIGHAGKNGSYLVRGRIPSSESYGNHKIVVKTHGKRYTAKIRVIPDNSRRNTGATTPLVFAWAALAALVTAFFVGSRRRRRPVAAVAVPDTDVPMLDTWDFVPVLRSRRTARGRAKPKGKSAGAKPTAKKPGAKKPAAKEPVAKSKPPAGSQGRTAAKKPKAVKGRATTERSEPKAPKRVTPPGKEAEKPEQPQDPGDAST